MVSGSDSDLLGLVLPLCSFAVAQLRQHVSIKLAMACQRISFLLIQIPPLLASSSLRPRLHHVNRLPS